MTGKREKILAQLAEIIDANVQEDRIEKSVVEILREPVRDLEAEAKADDGFMRWKHGKQLIIRAVIELKPKEGAKTVGFPTKD